MSRNSSGVIATLHTEGAYILGHSFNSWSGECLCTQGERPWEQEGYNNITYIIILYTEHKLFLARYIIAYSCLASRMLSVKL